MHRILFLLMMLPFMLLAEDASIPNESEILGSAHTPLTTIYGIPETNIMGVNVINGDYNYSSVDFDLPGSDPLVFQRIYCSSQKCLMPFFNGWSQNLSSYVKTYPEDSSEYKKSPKGLKENFHVVVSGSLYGTIPFRTEMKNKHGDIKINPDIFKKGVSNCRKGHISGRTNIKNMKVSYTKDGVTVTNPDGTKQVHKRKKNILGDRTHNLLLETIKPNGLKTTFQNHGLVLSGVKSLTHNNGISNQIGFYCPDYLSTLYITDITSHRFCISGGSGDGKTAKYTFDCRLKRAKLSSEQNNGFIILMSAFESSHLPSERYRYFERHDGYESLSKRSGRRHKTTIDYYENGYMVELYNNCTEFVTSDHIACNRVEQINVAVNGPKDLQKAFHFAYHENKKTKEAFTEVLNEHNHLTRFHYSTKNYRLNCVEKYTGNSEHFVYRRDRLKYGAKGTPLEGDLLFKMVESSDGTVHYGENYDYDERGNVLKKSLHYRTFNDSKAHPITTKENPHSKGNHCLHGGEIKSTLYTYNELNLPTSEDDGRLKTILKYHVRNGKNTNLLKSKLTQKDQKTLRREFYTFDLNAGLTQKIEDDGVGNSPDDLSRVNYRRNIRIKNREEIFAGLPVEIDVWGSNGQEEKRISRKTLKYDSHGYVEKETHYDSNNAFAFEVHKVRDLQGNVISETDPISQTTNRNYDEYGCLLEEQGPSLEYHMEYTYDWLQRPIKITRKCSDGIDLTTCNRYDLEGKITKVEDPYGFATKFIYNEQGRPIEIIHPPIRTDKGTWIRPREYKQYNFLGHLISETDAKGAVTLYKPNDAGLPLKITYPDGTFERFKYSLYGEVLEKVQRNGSKVVYFYDDFSRPISEETYDREGNLLKKCIKEYSGLLLRSETDGEGVKTKYTYDYAGRISEVRQGHALNKYDYDSLGRLKEEQRYFGDNANDYIATRYSYNLLNQVIRKKEIDGNRKTHSKVKIAYDPDGNVTSTTTWTHAGEATTTNTYDPRGNLSSSTDSLGNTTYYHHRYDFFFEGKNLPCVEVIDPAGVKTTTISDPHGSLILTQIHSPFGQLLSETELFYDLCGNLVRKEQHLPTDNIVTLYEYDSCSRLFRQVNGAESAEQITTTFVYNPFGELSETQYADGTSKHHIYDGIGRLSEEWSDDKSIHYAYTYNKQDLLKTAVNCNTKKETVRKYSPEGNLILERFENGLEIKYKYDKFNRVTECIYPDQSSVKQTYNPVFLSKAERVKEGQVTYEATFSDFDRSGKPKNITFPEKSGKLSLSYDRLNRPTKLSYPHYKEKEISYDNRGLLISKIVNDDLQKFDHDSLQQLTLEKTKDYSHTYENDALHRHISVDGIAQTHNAVHQLTQGVDDAYKYDPKGRRTQDSKTEYTYDKFDRLVKVEQGDSIWTYTYDAFNRKMFRTVNGETTYYLYNGHEEIGSYSNKQTCIDLKILSATEGSIPIAIELGDQNYSPLISSQGHIVGLVEMNTGDLADLSFLTLFGKDLANKPLSPWRFCGKRHEDAALGLIDFGFRFYHPKSAQWLTQDPLGESDGPNLYVYVSNNPACFIDRFGLFSCSDAWDGFKEACGNCWDTVKDYCSNAWDNAGRDSYNSSRDLDNCSWVDRIAENQVVDFGDTSFIYEYASDAGSFALDCSPAGNIKSMGEFITGYDLVTREKTSRALALIGSLPCGNIVMGVGKTVAKGGKALANSKIIDRVVGISKSIFGSRASNASGIAKQVTDLIGFTPKILEGNNKWGLKHIMTRHAYGARDHASKFIEGMGKNEIRDLLIQHTKGIESWTVGKHNTVSVLVDTGKIIGKNLEGNPTSFLRIVVKQERVRTAFPE